MHLSTGMKGVVVGLGKSGLAAVDYLHQQGVEIAVSEHRDLKQISSEELATLKKYEAKLETGGHSEEFLLNADILILSPGVPTDLPTLQAARDRGIPILGELALAAEKINVPIIAVTGSNGKTTVTSLIGHLLQAAGKKVFVGGNIGTPVLEYLMNPTDTQVMVLELSSFQLESAGKFRPDIGLLLNLSPDHLDRHGSMKAYVAAKRKLFIHQKEDDTAIIGADDPLIMTELLETAATVEQFGCTAGSRAKVDTQSVRLEPGFETDDEVEIFDLSATRLNSLVNRYNVAAAVLAARVFGCNQEDIRSGLADFQPPQHRMTPVGKINHIYFVNDSKATNVGAVVAALSGFKKDVILIVGGRDKGSDFSALRQAIREHVKQLVIIGEAGAAIAEVVHEIVDCQFAKTMKEAVAMAFASAQQDDTVLLAPACASFDMFKNYEQRGRVFTECVQDLKSKIEV